MNKIFKILSILVIGFVMFSCSTPTNDPTLYVPEPSSPETPIETPTEDPTEETPIETPTEDPTEETPVETPSDDPLEETPEVQTYSIIFTTKDSYIQIVVDYLNSLDEFKNLEEGTEVMLYKHVYLNSDTSEVTKEIVETSAIDFTVMYDNNSEIDSVVIGNEDVEVEVICEDLLQFKD